MSASMLIAALWALSATLVALLPMRFQYKPGLALFLMAPCLIVYIGYQHGFWIAALGLAAFVSMFRNPLIYFYRKFRGKLPEAPQ